MCKRRVVWAGWWVAVFVAVWSVSARAQTAPAAPLASAFVVQGAAVFDGHALHPDTDVLVRDGRIATLGRPGQRLDVPSGATVIAGRGRTLLPGLIDSHTHSYGPARRDALRLGVTTELEMFGQAAGMPAAKADRTAMGVAAGADLWSAGILATVPRGHGTQYGFKIPTVDQPAQAEAFVAARAQEGSDYLKIVIEDGSAFAHQTPSLNGETVAALSRAARAAGLMPVAHVSTAADAVLALRNGVAGLVHVYMTRPASAELVELAVQRKAFVVSTLSVAATVSGADEGRRLADDAQLAPWLAVGQTASLRASFPAAWQNAQLLPQAIDNVRSLHAAGVPLLAGTDAGNPGTAHGASMHSELALLVRAGLTPIQALTAATALPARHFGLADRGRIAVGLRADLLLVQGDPTQDILATRAIVALWKNGHAVDRSLQADERPLPAAPAAAAQALISDFEDGSLRASQGQAWMVTADTMAGGKSTATQAWLSGGADGSAGCLQVQGVVAPELPYAWAGTLYMPGSQPFAPVDFGARRTLVFKVRGPARELRAMIFSGPASNRQPAQVVFSVSPQWTEQRIPLSRFAGVDLSQLRGLAFTAGLPAGPFSFDIDDVRIE